jgi:WD40 repeat protein
MQKAREMLRQRLLRRGMVLPTALLFTLMVQKASATTVPATLAMATVKGALLFGGGKVAGAGVLSTKVAALAEEVLKSIALTKLKLSGAALLVMLLLGVIATAGGFVVREVRATTKLHPAGGCSSSVAAVDTAPSNWQLIRSFKGQNRAIQALALTADGKLLASAEEAPDSVVRLWDVATGKERRSLKGHAGSILALAFAPDGKTLGSASQDGTVKLWQVSIGTGRATLRGHGAAVLSVAFAPGGAFLASAGADGTVRIWNAGSGRETAVLSGSAGPVAAVAYSPDGKLLAAGSQDGTVKLWESATGRELGTIQAQEAGISALRFSPDGKTLATGSADKTAAAWDVASRRRLYDFAGHDAAITGVAFTTDNKSLVSASLDKTLREWPLAGGPGEAIIRDPSDSVQCLACAGSLLAAGSADGIIKFWRVERQQLVQK